MIKRVENPLMQSGDSEAEEFGGSGILNNEKIGEVLFLCLEDVTRAVQETKEAQSEPKVRTLGKIE